MSDFANLAKRAFEGYHDAPLEPATWALTDAYGHVVEFLKRHDSIDEMPGLREAFQAMTPAEWESLCTRYPEDVQTIIAPVQRDVNQTG
jgi:hypothetical protein